MSEKLLKTVLKTGFKNSEEDFKKLCDSYQIGYVVPDPIGTYRPHIIKKKSLFLTVCVSSLSMNSPQTRKGHPFLLLIAALLVAVC